MGQKIVKGNRALGWIGLIQRAVGLAQHEHLLKFGCPMEDRLIQPNLALLYEHHRQ